MVARQENKGKIYLPITFVLLQVEFIENYYYTVFLLEIISGNVILQKFPYYILD